MHSLSEWEDQQVHLRAHRQFRALLREALDTHDTLGVGKERTMTRNDPLDQPVTLRSLVDTYNELKREAGFTATKSRTPSFKQVLHKLVKDASTSDYIAVDFGGPQTYIYRIANQPQRRVQVGDLVTVPGSSYNAFPQVVRVVETNVPKPKSLSTKAALAISPEDATKIEAANGGSIKSWHVNTYGSDRR